MVDGSLDRFRMIKFMTKEEVLEFSPLDMEDPKAKLFSAWNPRGELSWNVTSSEFRVKRIHIMLLVGLDLSGDSTFEMVWVKYLIDGCWFLVN